MKYSLKDIARVTGGELRGDGEMVVGRAFVDSRTLVAGDFFVAIAGRNHDGHDYLEELYARGVRAFLVERDVDLPTDASRVIVKNSVDALHSLAADWRTRFGGTVVGITGSNGKTVVKEWIAAAAPEGVKIFRSPKSWNSQVGVPLSVLMIEGDEDVAVIEAGISRPGEMERLARIVRPDVGVFTMLGDAHQENFDSREQKRDEKWKLFEGARVVIADRDNVDTVREVWRQLGHDVEVGEAQLAMRLELKEGVNGSLVVDDSYSSDINSLAIALDYLGSVAGERKRVVVLGDILQSGFGDEELYRRVDELIKRAGIARFVGIGSRISRYVTDSYPTVEAFLESLTRDDVADRAILVKGNRAARFERLSHALSQRSHTTTLEVDLDAVVHNLNVLRVPSVRTMAMVKAGAYGHGAWEIAQTMQHEGVDYLAVAFADEGVMLRERGIVMPIVVLNADSDSFDLMIAHRLEPEIYNFESLEAFEAALAKYGERDYPVHIKLDTGMHRLGFGEGDLERLLGRLFGSGTGMHVASVFSHLACADEPSGEAFTRRQIERFERMTRVFPPHVVRHLANSAAARRLPEARFDMVRLGLGLYGFGDEELRPVSALRTRIVQVRDLDAGETVGYGCEGVVERPTRVAMIPIGYADGLDRHLGCGRWHMRVDDTQVPTLGRISMDTCALDITGTEAKVGDSVTVFDGRNTVEAMARELGTIPYEVMTSISPRVKRIYVKE